MIRATVAGHPWRAMCEPARRRMARELENPAAAQAVTLSRILSENADCDYARAHGIRPRMDATEFRDAAPLCRYDDLEPWIERAKLGESDVLFPGKAEAFERSSGSTSAAKWIPFRAALRSEFTEAVRAWMGDLYQANPSLARGRAWWVTSPLARPAEVTAGGIPTGLDDDAYLGRAERIFANWLRVNAGDSIGGTAAELLRAPDLRLISVWNPSYLLLVWDRVHEISGAGNPREIWPHLRVVSGWADAGAAADAARVREIFDHAVYQPKGLLATEGVITIPWGEGCGVPALRSHFLEFLEWPAGQSRLVHELELDREYEVIMTTSGGLWRYRLGDIVRAEGMAAATPRLRFIGRADGVSDLRGEKLNPVFVGRILSDFTQRFAFLAPATEGNRYIVFTDDVHLSAARVDEALMANQYYRHARSVGQLECAIRFLITADAERIWLERCTALGQRPGTIKRTPLHAKPGWELWFRGSLQS